MTDRGERGGRVHKKQTYVPRPPLRLLCWCGKLVRMDQTREEFLSRNGEVPKPYRVCERCDE